MPCCATHSSVSRHDLAFSMSIYHWLELYADVIVQYVLTATHTFNLYHPSLPTQISRHQSPWASRLVGHPQQFPSPD
jgi:hypothetical protein